MKSRPVTDIAVLSPTPSHPHDFGNRKRIYQICSGLKKRGARISFIHYPLEADWRSRCPADGLQMMREEWDDVHIVAPSIPIHCGASGEDHGLDEWWDPALESFLKWYLNTRTFDAFLVNYLYLSKALTLKPRSCLGILDTHDKFAGRRQMLASIGIGPEFFHTTEEEERRGIARADLAIAIKDQEEEYFKGLSGNDVMTVPFAEPARGLASLEPDEEGYLRVGLLGARNNLNFHNMRRFLELAVPKVRSHMAPLKFILAGTMCRDFAHLSVDNGIVELMGPVDDIADFYKAVDVVAVPMDVSSGQKIKIGEALAFGVPLISHAHAFEGYVSSHPLQTCRSFEQMAEACLELSFDRQMLDGLAAACRRSAVGQLAVADRALDTMIDKVHKAVPKDLIYVSADRLADERFLKEHLLSLAHLLSSFARVEFLIDGDFGLGHQQFLRESRAFAKFFATGQVEEYARAEGVGNVDGLDQYLSENSVSRVWLYDPAELNELVRQELSVGVVRHLSRVDWVEVPSSGLASTGGFDFAIGRATGSVSVPRIEFTRSFASHAIDNSRSAAFVDQAFANGPSSVWIATCKQNMDLARTFAQMLQNDRRYERIFLISDGGWAEVAQSSGSKIIHIAAQNADSQLFQSRPSLIIDLTSRGEPSYLYAAMFVGSRVPVWRPALLGKPARGEHEIPEGCRLATLVEAFLQVSRQEDTSSVKGVLHNRLDLSPIYNQLIGANGAFI